MSDMSCQQSQSSQNSDDPYIFTDSPTTTSVYSSQFGRLTPIKLYDNQQSFRSATNSPVQRPTLQQEHKLLSHQSPRLNGAVQIPNGYQSPTTVFTALKPSTTTSVNLNKTSNRIITKQKSLPFGQQTQPIPSTYQQPQPNYLKPPPPLYHNNQQQNILHNHSIVRGGGGPKVSSFSTAANIPSSIPTFSNNTPLSTSKNLNTGGPKRFNSNEIRPNPSTKIKCETTLNKIGDNCHTSPKNINGNEFSIPQITGTKKGNHPVGGSTLNKQLGSRLFKRSTSQTSSQYEGSRITTSQLSNVSAQFANTLLPSKNNEWHSPGSFIFDYVGPGATRSEAFELIGCTQNVWFSDVIDENNILNRDQKLEIKQAILRRQAIQYSNSQKLRTNLIAKRRLLLVSKDLIRLQIKEEPTFSQKCCITNCSNDALTLTAYCYIHITHNSDQVLFHPCTAKFSDNTPCRVPVFDISHELPLCREHAWKRDNYDRMIQEQKPKKPPRKKPKPSAMTRPPKRNKKKKKPQPKHLVSPHSHHDHNLLSSHLHQHQHSSISITQTSNTIHIEPKSTQIFNQKNSPVMKYYVSSSPMCGKPGVNLHASGNQIQFSPQTLASFQNNQQKMLMIPGNTQDLLNVCENSSAYESSEDTGVGGLSESELISHDVIEEIPLGDTKLLEEHDLTNVLNQIPEDAFDDFFGVQQNSPFEPTQEEQEDLQRALEAVDEQVKNLQQLSDSNFLGDLLDVDDQMLVTT